MRKVILTIIIEAVIIAALFFIGIWLDLTFQSPPSGGETAGHPAPVFSWVLPIVEILADLTITILIIIRSFKKAIKKDNEEK